MCLATAKTISCYSKDIYDVSCGNEDYNLLLQSYVYGGSCDNKDCWVVLLLQGPIGVAWLLASLKTAGFSAFWLRGYRVHVDAIVVGALGTWDPINERVLKLLHVSRSYDSLMRRLIVSETVHWSRDIYVEHVSGTRQ
ncbi:uncharacterized protein LOC117788549 [Drosophila innubila]|uniref:uncharacterized protein LOC117788549 n=1 Tax=Drosophila innubila TaxID=198719 RepID=UPI00148C4D62|nr:uncharacterized protein LOC117788549 [Drosophila innubila]